MTENKISFKDDFNIFELIKNIWTNRVLFISIVILFGLGSIIYSLAVDEKYTVDSIIKPADPTEETTLNEASPIIGLSIGGYSHDPVINNILITLKSETFLEIFYHKYKDNDKIFDFEDIEKDPENSNSYEEMMRYAALKKLHKMIDFQVNSDHNTISISVKMKNKYIAYDFLVDFLKTLRSYIVEQNIQDMEDDLKFYKELSEKTQNPVIKQMLEQKVMQKIEKKFKLSSNIFRIVQEPVVPAKRSYPNRTFMVIMTTLIGTLFSFMVISLKPAAVKIFKMLKDIEA